MINATWGTAEHSQKRDVRIISIPVNFSTEVIVADAEVFRFTPVSPLTDDDLSGELAAAINGDGTDWALTVTLPLDIEGSLEIDITGEVFNWETQEWYSVEAEKLRVRLNTIKSEM